MNDCILVKRVFLFITFVCLFVECVDGVFVVVFWYDFPVFGFCCCCCLFLIFLGGSVVLFFFSFNIHRSGMLTALFGYYMAGAI